MKILVSGATGYIGSNLVKELATREYQVYAIARKEPGIKLPGINYIEYDGTYSSLVKALGDLKIEVILNLATHFCVNHSKEDLDKLIDANLRLGLHLLEFSTEFGVGLFVTASTYAQSIDGSSYNPQNLYAATKQSFEDLLHYYSITSKGTKYITLELSDTYGPSDPRRKFINLAIQACRADETFKMSPGEQQISYIYIDDVVNGFLSCLELFNSGGLKQGEKYCLCSDEIYTLNELVRMIWEINKKKPEIINGFYPYREREIMKLTRRYPKLPGWTAAVSIREGIAKLMRQNSNT